MATLHVDMKDQLAPLPRHLQVFEDAKKALKLVGLQCLTPQWMGTTHLYEFRCQQGHIFERHGAGFRYGGPKVCPVCRGVECMQRFHELASREGVKCLDLDWRGSTEHYRFECPQGHVWTRSPDRARHMRCPHCVKQQHGEKVWLRDGLERLLQAAQSQGGQCLSKSYEGGHVKYDFRCRVGHQWKSRGAVVLQGSWCPQCIVRERSESYLLSDGLQRLHDLAREKGGQCLSTSYTGTAAKYAFVCGKGHQWECPGASIVHGYWCRKCSHERLRLGIEAARTAASNRGGRCLSENYVSSSIKLEWMCDRGHVWKARLSNIRRGHWCPQCAFMAQIHKPNSKAWAKYLVSKRASEPPA